MSYFLKPTITKISPTSSTQNWYDESTYLDNSTVPTYEEFTTKTKTKVKKKKSILRKKLGYLNSTEASCLVTDDETDNDEDENFSPTIDELTNTINNLDIKNQNTLIFNNNHLNINKVQQQQQQPFKIIQSNFNSKENLLVIKDTPEKFNNYDTPLKNVVKPSTRILTGTAPPKMVNSSLFQNTASIKSITPTVYRSPASVYSPSTNKLNDSNEYVFYYNKITQTSFVFSSADESNKKSSKEPSVIVLNDSIEEDSDNESTTYSNQIMKKLVISQTCSSCSSSPTSPQISAEILDKLNNVTLRRSNKPINETRKSLISNKSKRISICGDGMSKEQLRINETILDESENESDYKNGRIYSLYESASEGLNDSDSDKSITNNQLTPKVTNKKWSKSKGTTSSDSETPKRKSKQKPSNLMNKLKIDDATTSSDGKYEKFLNEFKLISQKKELTEVAKRKDDLKNFIVDDEDEEEDQDEMNNSNKSDKQNIKPKKKNSLSSSDSSSEDEQLFYIRTNKKFNDKEKSNPKKQKSKISRSSLLNDSSSSSSSSSNESSFNSSSSSDEKSVWKKIRKNKPKSKDVFKTPSVSTTRKIENDLRLIKTHQQAIKQKQPTKLSFVESLSTKLDDESLRDPAVLAYMKKYKNKNVRNELLRECYNKLNEGAFENKLPKDMKLIWNSKLTATGGYCKNSIKDQTSQIELSTKVCDTPERMRDVLAHEMCHAATFLLNGILDGHGSIWKNWAARVNFTFKQIPKITVYHSYQIKKKFIYKCQRCLSEFSKSIDINKQVCGICHGKFDLINANKPQQATNFDDILNNNETGEFKTKTDKLVPSTPRQLNAFSQFVKDNYKRIKQEENIVKHQDVMKELSVQFKQLSTKNK